MDADRDQHGRGYVQSPFSASENSWPGDGSQTPHYPSKRVHSPSLRVLRPNKRLHIYKSPAVMRSSPSTRHGMFIEGPPEFEEGWRPQKHNTDDLRIAHQSANRSPSRRRLDADPRNPSAYHTSSYAGGWHHSTTHSMSGIPRLNITDLVHTPVQRLMQRAQTAAPEVRRSYQDDRHEQSQTPFINRNNNLKKSHLLSPIWNVRVPREQHQPYQEERDPIQYQTLSRREQMTRQLSTYPFDDGGIPGNGGSSSGEDVMINPAIDGRIVHMGSTRNHQGTTVDENSSRGSGGWEPLQEVVTQEGLWNSHNRLQRRKCKDLARNLSDAWHQAQAEGDTQEMNTIERKAKNAKLAAVKPSRGRADQAEYDINPSRNSSRSLSRERVSQSLVEGPSPKARIEYNRQSPQDGVLIPYDEQNGRCQSRSCKLLAFATENFRSRSQSLHVRTPATFDGGRSKSRISPTYKSPHQPLPYEIECTDDEQDSTPLEQMFRRFRHRTQEAHVNETPYRATNVLPKESMSYSDHSNPAYMNNGRPQPRIIPYHAGVDRLKDVQTIIPEDQSMPPPASTSGFQTPRPHVRPGEMASEQRPLESPEVISLLSSAESSPVPKRSLPMKDRLPPPKKKAVPKPNKIRGKIPQQTKRKEIVKEEKDPETTRQQKFADRIIAAEVKVANEDLETQMFGEVISLTAEEEEVRAAAKREAAQRKQEAKAKEKLFKEEAERLAEIQKQKDLEEAREKERLEKEREERSKKAKREAERKQQLALEEAIREEKRKNTVERIETQRAQEAAVAEAREKVKEKKHRIELDDLKLQNLKKDLEIKKLQAASLVAAKAVTPETSKNSPANVAPSFAPAEDPDSLFLPEATPTNGIDSLDVYDVDDRKRFRAMDTGVRSAAEEHSPFRRKMAQERDKLETEKRALEEKKRSEALRLRLEKPKEGRASKRPSPTIRASEPAPSKEYPSEVRFLSDVEHEKLLNENKAAKAQANRKRNAERRKKDFHKIANQKKKKLLEEARQGGYTISDTELKLRVDAHMKEREEKYQRNQAKKYGQGAGSSSFNSYFPPQPRTQSYTQLQSLSQPQPQQNSSSFSSSSSAEQGDADPGNQAPKTAQAEPNEHIPAAKRDRGGRFARASAMRRVDHFETDSDESEEDPDDEPALEAMIAAKKGTEQPRDDGEGRYQAKDVGVLDPNNYSTQLEDDMNTAFAELSSANESQHLASQAPADSCKSQSTNAQFQDLNQGEDMINIYTVEKTKTVDGEEHDTQQMKMFTDTEEANDFAEGTMEEYRKNTAVKEHSFNQNFKEGLYSGQIIFDDESVITVYVTSELKEASEFHGLDVTKIKKSHGKLAWVIKRELKEPVTDPKTNHTIEIRRMEDADDKVYTCREWANHDAAENFIAFLRPEKDSSIDYEEEWSNWQKMVRDKLKETDEAGKCFEAGVAKEDGQLAWLKWDEVDYKVEVKQTVGPKN